MKRPANAVTCDACNGRGTIRVQRFDGPLIAVPAAPGEEPEPLPPAEEVACGNCGGKGWTHPPAPFGGVITNQ